MSKIRLCRESGHYLALDKAIHVFIVKGQGMSLDIMKCVILNGTNKCCIVKTLKDYCRPHAY